MHSRHAATASKQDAFQLRYATLRAASETTAQEPIDVNHPAPASSSADPLDQKIQSRQEGDVIASYQCFELVAFGKKRRHNEVD